MPRTIWNQITPRINSDWNGDVWKSIVHSRTLTEIDTYTFIADRGVGIIFPRENRNKLILKSNTNFKSLRFKEYYINHNNFMNPINFNKLDLIELFK